MPFNDDGKKRTGATSKSDEIGICPFPSGYMDPMLAGRRDEWLDSRSPGTIGEILDGVCTLSHVAEEILLNARGLLNCSIQAVRSG
jgi:hypothetical protein